MVKWKSQNIHGENPKNQFLAIYFDWSDGPEFNISELDFWCSFQGYPTWPRWVRIYTHIDMHICAYCAYPMLLASFFHGLIGNLRCFVANYSGLLQSSWDALWQLPFCGEMLWMFLLGRLVHAEHHTWPWIWHQQLIIGSTLCVQLFSSITFQPLLYSYIQGCPVSLSDSQ